MDERLPAYLPPKKEAWQSLNTLSAKHISQKPINSGYYNKTTIDKIYGVHGDNESVTEILKLMSIDRRRGGHPQLQ